MKVGRSGNRSRGQGRGKGKGRGKGRIKGDDAGMFELKAPYHLRASGTRFSNLAVDHLADDLCADPADILDAIYQNQSSLPRSSHWRMLNPLLHRTKEEMDEAGLEEAVREGLSEDYGAPAILDRRDRSGARARCPLKEHLVCRLDPVALPYNQLP